MDKNQKWALINGRRLIAMSKRGHVLAATIIEQSGKSDQKSLDLLDQNVAKFKKTYGESSHSKNL